jgi:hypothetical protein
MCVRWNAGTISRIPTSNRNFIMTSRLLSSLVSKAACALIGYAAVTAVGHGQLLTDNFNRTGELNGSSPTYSATPETWTSNPGDFSTTGTAGVINSPAPSSADAYIGIPGDSSGLAVGTYTLSFTIAQPGNYGEPNAGFTFVAAGFGEDTSTTGVPTLSSDLDPFLALYQGDGEFCIYDKEVGQDPDAGGNLLVRLPYLVSGDANMILTLVVNSDGSDTMAATLNGTPLLLDGATTYTADLIPITNLFLAEDSGNTTSFSDLSLDVPEPRSWAMMLGGAAILLWTLHLRRLRA